MRYTYRFASLRRRKNAFFVALQLVLIGLLLVLLFRVTKLDLAFFLASFASSLFVVSISYVLALVISIFLALVTLKNERTEKYLLPLLDAFQSFPSLALLPLLLAYFGKGPASLIIIVTIEMIWPILFSVIGGIKGIRGDLGEAATIFGARGGGRLFSFTIPALFPSIVTGSIVSWGEAWETVIGAEIILSASGLGKYFSQLGETGASGVVFATIVGLIILLYIINKLFWLPILEKATKYQTE